MVPELKMLHLQLTRKCNLHCRFCGQDHCDPAEAMDFADWLAVLDQLREYAPGAAVVLWGGEPLLYPRFREVAEYAAERGFPLDLITNGTLIADHADLLRTHFRRIFVSVDGPAAVHDGIRGRGAFARVRSGLELLRGGNAELVMMSVLAPENLEVFDRLPFGLPVDRVILHEMIYLTDSECSGLTPAAAGRWNGNSLAGYPEMLHRCIDGLKNRTFPLPVEFQPHFSGGFCREPFRHLHVGVDGETSFCTDFTEYTTGNVKRRTLKEIFEGEEAERFRKKGNEPFCSHCSWKNTEETIVRFKTEKGK